MISRTFVRGLTAILVAAMIAVQNVPVRAGTTGGLSGTVTDGTSGNALAGVKITAASPSQIATGRTDASGHFQFLNLAPDTYTVSAQISGYSDVALSGVTVVSDNTRVLSLTANKVLRTIGSVTATRTNGSLVRSGTTADVYSVNAAQQAKLAAAGGGGTLDSAFSALSTVPGVSVMPGQAGYIGAGATLSIRGGDYDQIGYQFDGIPINRSFDNYPSSATSSLGQQELQVYTGAPPPSTLSEGISGYINQVIKTGTSPGFTTGTLGIGSPYYHKIAFETGGKTLDDRLSYYVGLGGYNQSQRFVDQFDGASLSNTYGYPYGAPCGAVGTYTQAQVPSCYVDGKYTPEGNILLPFNSFSQSQVADRDSIVNLHYYFPHKDGSRDDFQALYDNSALSTQVYSSANDLGGVALLTTINENYNGVGPVSSTGRPNSIDYTDGFQYNAPTGGVLPENYRQLSSIYYFPNVASHVFGDQISPDLRDGFNNDQSIVKLQFTKSLGSAAYFRAYGYSYYSDWLNTGANSAYIPFGAINGDYELESHARGAGFQFADQLNAQNLLSIDGDYTNAKVVRDNNSEYVNGVYPADDVAPRTILGVLVDSSNPTNGICYSATGVPTNCFSDPTHYNQAAGGPQFATLQEAYNGTIAPVTAATCGAGPCKYLVVGNGEYATYNDVTPQFFGASINDEFRPTSKLTMNLGLRLDDYQFIGGDTSGGNARAFWYNAYNAEVCENTTSHLLSVRATPGAACAAGTAPVDFSNPSGDVTQTYPEFQPRAGFTYAFTPTTVFRAAYGRYTQPPNTAFEQYDVLQANAPLQLYGSYNFQQYGFTSPNHPIPPAASNNYDFSIEQALPGAISFKLSPFLRTTQNQGQQFFLDRATNFVSGLNVGNQTSRGFEFELDKGDFSREGLSAKLSFAYTNSYIRYNTLSNGSTVLTPVVNAIKLYNSYTKAGGGAPCYTLEGADGTPGVPAPCSAATIANPYYNAPLQNVSQFDGRQNYVPYDTVPQGIGISATQYGVPYVASLALNEKIKRLSITPIVQLFAGQRYGSPLSTLGIDPTMCGATLAGASTVGDPRYNFGAAGGAPFDATSCGQLSDEGGNATGIPNMQTGAFDGIGAYVEPSQLLMHVQLSYDVTKTVNITANFTNLVNTCFGGSKVPWAVKGACGYGLDEAGLTGGIGNTYNPGDAIQPALKYSYEPFWAQQPVGIYVNASVKL